MDVWFALPWGVEDGSETLIAEYIDEHRFLEPDDAKPLPLRRASLPRSTSVPELRTIVDMIHSSQAGRLDPSYRASYPTARPSTLGQAQHSPHDSGQLTPDYFYARAPGGYIPRRNTLIDLIDTPMPDKMELRQLTGDWARVYGGRAEQPMQQARIMDIEELEEKHRKRLSKLQNEANVKLNAGSASSTKYDEQARNEKGTRTSARADPKSNWDKERKERRSETSNRPARSKLLLSALTCHLYRPREIEARPPRPVRAAVPPESGPPRQPRNSRHSFSPARAQTSHDSLPPRFYAAERVASSSMPQLPPPRPSFRTAEGLPTVSRIRSVPELVERDKVNKENGSQKRGKGDWLTY